MFDITLSYQWLRWRRPTGPVPDPPKGIERAFVDTPSGPLEILHVSSPHVEPSSSPREPLFFIHGGMGSAAVWTEYLGFFAERGVPAYAISLRGHGASWHPSFLRMAFGTTKAVLAEDAIAGIRWVEAREGKPVVLVGHSGGGGLCQYMLTCQSVRVKGLALLAPIPGFGGPSVFQNWSRFDPWLVLRAVLQGWHPNSPLSHPALTKRAFFSAGVADSYVVAFQRRMCAYESYLWPWGMMRPFADPGTVMRQVIGGGGDGDRMLVLSGSEDKLMTVPIMKDLAARHRAVSSSVSLLARTGSNDGEGEKMEVDARATDSRGAGVRSSFVLGAGHHLQNDVSWQEGAQKLLEFYEQL